MKTLVCGLTLAAIALNVAGCANSTDPVEPKPEPVPLQLSAVERQLVGEANSFSLALLQQAVAETSALDNVFISPLSASYALGMAFNGAAGTTREEMRTTLGFGGLTDSQINESYRHLFELLPTVDPNVRVDLANSIWLREGFDVRPEFLEVNQTYFGAVARTLDFSQSWSCDTINQWVNNNTQGKIPSIVEPPIDRATMAYLINAVYFKADWTKPFDPNVTYDAEFTTPGGAVIPCRMMSRTAEFAYSENDLFQSVSLPYGSRGFRMTVLLPKAGHTSTEIVEQLMPSTWATWLGSQQQAEVYLGLPRFRFSFDMIMNDALRAMGMPTAFEAGSADFTGIDSTGGLFISNVLQKTFVQVDEVGTEAAAVTSVEIGRTSMPPMMTCDRPFVVVIHELESGAILFMGVINNPEWTE